MRRIVSGIIYALSAAIGVLAFIYPFFVDVPLQVHGQAHSQDAPLVTAALVGLSVVALLVELQGRAISAKTVALLGVLVSITSVLRFIETAIPIPGGFSPIFAPIILAGYVFGGRFGFLMGAFTLLASALITGGVGPWLPYQMFTAGWVGMTAGWLPHIKLPASRNAERAKRLQESLTLFALCVLGFIWGLLYGVIMNIYFWPFAVGSASQVWAPGLSLWETLSHYAVFYMVTSLAWDMARAIGNVVLILLLGTATVRALSRFRRRFHFEVRPADA
ncbi:MAG: ECF transporter S component [Anaerolineales bacterium]|nr:ECF transporter S component [Anaerolineales bacterium]